jgi:hypothetical protein
MNRTRVHHPQLPFPDEERREPLPPPVQEQCRELLCQMLRRVVAAERPSKEGADHE